MQHLKHILQMIFWTTPALSNARCHCTEYYKYSRILPKHHTWLEIQNSITIIRGYLFGISKFVSTFYIFYMLRCLHSIIHCKFYTLTNQSLLLWHKYLESLGKNNIFTNVFFLQYVMEDEHTKGPSHNNPEEAANYVKAVNLLLQSFVNDICGFDRYKHLDAWETFLHTLSQLLSKLDSTYFTNMDTQVVLDTMPDKSCATFLACPEEAANKVQQHVSSDSIPTGPEVTSKIHLQESIPCFDQKGQRAVTRLFSHLQDAHNHMSEVAKAIVNVSEVSSPEQFTFVLQLAVRPIIQLKIPPHLSAPTELKFEKERLTPEEITEENCCNLILP